LARLCNVIVVARFLGRNLDATVASPLVARLASALPSSDRPMRPTARPARLRKQ
jgi:hypothetical protein